MGFLGNHLKIARGNSFFFYKFSFYYISSSWYYNVNSKSKERENPPIITSFAHGFVFPKPRCPGLSEMEGMGAESVGSD